MGGRDGLRKNAHWLRGFEGAKPGCEMEYIEQKTFNMKPAFLLLAIVSFSAMAQDRVSLSGDWNGQSQYYATIGKTPDPAAHSITELSFTVQPGGKVIGSSPENGCKLLGFAVPGIVPTILVLDITLAGCKYAGFNRRFQGQGSYLAKEAAFSVSLSSFEMGAGKPSTFEVKATLKRPGSRVVIY